MVNITKNELKEILDDNGLDTNPEQREGIIDDILKRLYPLKTVPCKYCGKPTETKATCLCDNCWEIDGRILQFLKADKGKLYMLELLYIYALKNFDITSMYTVHIRRAKEEMEKIINE